MGLHFVHFNHVQIQRGLVSTTHYFRQNRVNFGKLSFFGDHEISVLKNVSEGSYLKNNFCG